MNATPPVFVYDDALETSEVLAAVYQPRGFQVERVTESCDDPRSTHRGQTVVVVRPASTSAPESQRPCTVVIGRYADPARHPDSRSIPACRLSSLFDYRELVNEVDRLLRASD